LIASDCTVVGDRDTEGGSLRRIAWGILWRWFGLLAGTLFWWLLPLGWRLAFAGLAGLGLLVGGLGGWWGFRQATGGAWRVALAAVLLALLLTIPTPSWLLTAAALLLVAALSADSIWSAASEPVR
jgi:hypothetical protein